MSTTATSLALPYLRTQQSLFFPQSFSSPLSLSLNPNFKPFSISAASLRPTLSLSSRFVPRVALSSEFDQEEDVFDDRERPSYSPSLRLFVGNLPFSVDSAQLAELFESAGNVEMVEVFTSLIFYALIWCPFVRNENWLRLIYLGWIFVGDLW